jgi:hypothetical protein
MSPPADTIAALVRWIVAYRLTGSAPDGMMRRALAEFPAATGSTFAIALTRANRAPGAKHG